MYAVCHINEYSTNDKFAILSTMNDSSDKKSSTKRVAFVSRSNLAMFLPVN